MKIKKKLFPLLVLPIFVLILALATACSGATAPSIVRNPPTNPQTAYERLSNAGWDATLVNLPLVPTNIMATRTSHPEDVTAQWDEDRTTRVWAEAVTISWWSTDALATIAYNAAQNALNTAQNLASDEITVTGGVWRNSYDGGYIVSNWIRTAGRFNAMQD